MTTYTQRGSQTGDSVVRRVGTDTSNRGIFMSGWMWRCWQALINDPNLARIKDHIIIVQGPWMKLNGGGAEDSAHYHDEGGCIDVRTTSYGELSGDNLNLFIYVASEYGFQFWRRDAEHGGMDPHAHGVFGSDYDLSSGAAEQVRELFANPRGDGLAGSTGLDYEKRFTPIRVGPPDELLQEDYMATSEAEQKLDQILRQTKATRVLVKAFAEQVGAVADAVAGLDTATDEIKSRITKSKRQLAELIAEIDQEA